jgi:hypothetical protein
MSTTLKNPTTPGVRPPADTPNPPSSMSPSLPQPPALEFQPPAPPAPSAPPPE